MILTHDDLPMTFDVYRSEADGIWVVHVDTENMNEDQEGPFIRLYLNDHNLHENPRLPVDDFDPGEVSIDYDVEDLMGEEGLDK